MSGMSGVDGSGATGGDTRPAEGYVTLPGLRLHYLEWEQRGGEPDAAPLLLLHGLASGSPIWELTAPALAAERRVVALDQRGHGLSDKPDDGYDFTSIVADDIAVANALALGPRFAVAGHSWGGNVALELAARHPDRVAALLLVDGGFGMLRERPNATWEQVSRDLAPPRFTGTPRATFDGWVRDEVPGSGPEVVDIMERIVELRPDQTVAPRLSFENHMKILRAMWDADADTLFPAVHAPTRYILAEGASVGGATEAAQDGFLAAKRRGAAQARDRMSSAPSVEVIWLPATVHDIPLQRPAELARLMGEFLHATAG
ncbi:MAG TPA: alpha/beta hydrolase [Ktedonobacterales bacterium]